MGAELAKALLNHIEKIKSGVDVPIEVNLRTI